MADSITSDANTIQKSMAKIKIYQIRSKLFWSKKSVDNVVTAESGWGKWYPKWRQDYQMDQTSSAHR